MTKPNGVELRIFDHFDSHYLPELSKFVIYVAENSRVHKSTKYVYQNKDWIKSLQNIMMDGWNAEVTEGYVELLRQQLGLKIKTKSLVAFDILYTINEEIYEKNKNGDWVYLLLDKATKPRMPQINRQSWETAFMLKLNRHKTLMDKFNKFLASLKTGATMDTKQFKEMFYKYFDKKTWKRDVKDVIYLLEAFRFAALTYNVDGSIDRIKVIATKHIKNFNGEIIEEWNRPLLEDFYYYVSKVINK